MTFNVSPSHYAGHIKCNGRDIPIDQYNYIEYGAECSAEANNGHSFSSWLENVVKNSTKIIAESNTQVSPFESLSYDMKK